jgi:hypothetical protein
MFSLIYVVLIPEIVAVASLLILPANSAICRLCTSIAKCSHWTFLYIPVILFGVLGASAAFELAWIRPRSSASTSGVSDLYQTTRQTELELNLFLNAIALLLLFVVRRFERIFRTIRLMTTSEAMLKKQALGVSEAYQKLLASSSSSPTPNSDGETPAGGDADSKGDDQAHILADLSEENADLRSDVERLERDIATMVKQSANASSGLGEMLEKEQMEKRELRAQLRELDRQLLEKTGSGDKKKQ